MKKNLSFNHICTELRVRGEASIPSQGGSSVVCAVGDPVWGERTFPVVLVSCFRFSVVLRVAVKINVSSCFFNISVGGSQ